MDDDGLLVKDALAAWHQVKDMASVLLVSFFQFPVRLKAPILRGI